MPTCSPRLLIKVNAIALRLLHEGLYSLVPTKQQEEEEDHRLQLRRAQRERAKQKKKDHKEEIKNVCKGKAVSSEDYLNFLVRTVVETEPFQQEGCDQDGIPGRVWGELGLETVDALSTPFSFYKRADVL